MTTVRRRRADWASSVVETILAGRGASATAAPPRARGAAPVPAGRAVLLGPTVRGRERVRPDLACHLLAHGVIIGRQRPAVERVTDLHGPATVKVVKRAGADAGPVVDRHESPPAGAALLGSRRR